MAQGLGLSCQQLRCRRIGIRCPVETERNQNPIRNLGGYGGLAKKAGELGVEHGDLHKNLNEKAQTKGKLKIGEVPHRAESQETNSQ